MHWIAIAAMARNRVIGKDGKIPWHISDEFRWFKKRTMGGVLVMGRKTYESIGRPLAGRETIVVSGSGRKFEGIKVIRSLKELEKENFLGREIFIAGGAEIYRQALSKCATLYLSVIHMEPEGDTFFPPFEDKFSLTEKISSHAEFDVFRYDRGGIEG